MLGLFSSLLGPSRAPRAGLGARHVTPSGSSPRPTCPQGPAIATAMGTIPARILASVNDPDQVADVVSLACSLAGDDRHAEVHALHVVLIPRALPLDAEMAEAVAFGESLLAKAEEVAEERFGRRVHTDLLQARAVGPAILEEVQERDVGVVVLGSRRNRGFEDGALGSTVEYVVRHANCRVVINVPLEQAGGGRPGGRA